MEHQVFANFFSVVWSNDAQRPGTFTAQLHDMSQRDQYGNKFLPGSQPDQMILLLKANHGAKGTGGDIWVDPEPIGVTRIYSDDSHILMDGEYDGSARAEPYVTNGRKLGKDGRWSWTYQPVKATEVRLPNGRMGLDIEEAVALEAAMVFKSGGVSKTLAFNSAGVALSNQGSVATSGADVLANLDKNGRIELVNKIIDQSKEDGDILSSFGQRIQLHQRFLERKGRKI